jgi:hypothetical protein
MKILDHFASSAHVRSIKSAASKLADATIPQDLPALYQFLSPQWLAGYMGLKKLIEKDYLEQEEDFFLSPAP